MTDDQFDTMIELLQDIHNVLGRIDVKLEEVCERLGESVELTADFDDDEGSN